MSSSLFNWGFIGITMGANPSFPQTPNGLCRHIGAALNPRIGHLVDGFDPSVSPGRLGGCLLIGWLEQPDGGTIFYLFFILFFLGGGVEAAIARISKKSA